MSISWDMEDVKRRHEDYVDQQKMGEELFHKIKDLQDTKSHNIGESDYAKHKIQPWDIWEEYKLNPWDADIVKRVLRTKTGNNRIMDYEKMIHICQERIRQLKEQDA